MKVVIFCGGQGLRLRDYSENTPKPMVPVGYRPIIWHLMKYYAHYGHKEFILCLGYRADAIKDYFLNYSETVTNDFVLTNGGADVKMLGTDINDWKITFVDTGMESKIGERLMAVKQHLGDDEMFMANYADCLTDAPLPQLIEDFTKSDKLASFLSVRPGYSWHAVNVAPDGTVVDLVDADKTSVWINGGYLIFRKEALDYFAQGDDIVPTVFRKLAAEKKLMSHTHNGFWACMDTFKEKMTLDDLHARDKAPWQVWRIPKTKTTKRTA